MAARGHKRGGRMRGRAVNGWLVLDKPVGLTSTSAVARVKRLFDARKAGHAGTLDPLASGCLPIALGEATKTMSFAVDGLKTYRFTISWGTETTTDDGEGIVSAQSDVRPDADQISSILPEFTGPIMQVPPAFSAVKIAGERAYDLARGGEIVELEAREIVIHNLSLVETEAPETAILEAVCGKGTYIRALARDMGRRLNTRGHISALRRLSVGPFTEDAMISLAFLEELRHNASSETSDELDLTLKPVTTALDDIPALAMTDQDAARIKSGQAVFIRGRDAPIFTGPAYATRNGVPLALGEVHEGAFNPKRVFNLAGSNGTRREQV